MDFLCGIEIDLVMFVDRRDYLFFVRESTLTSVLCASQKLFGLNVWIDIDLDYVCGPKMTCVFLGID